MSKNTIVIGGCIVAAVALVAVILLIVLGGPTKVELNNYVTMDFSGYDTEGEATLSFDFDRFEADYGSKIKTSYETEEPAWLLFQTCVGSYDFFPAYGLSNGDTVTFSWEDVDDEQAKEDFGVELIYSDMTFTVEGLKETTTFDPFEDIELVYSGAAPTGGVQIQNNSSLDVAEALLYDVSPSEGLSNGDIVTVSISSTNTSWLVKNYGMVPSSLSQTYTVEGLNSYVAELSEIPDETMRELQSHSEDVISAYVSGEDGTHHFDEFVTLENQEYVGCYLLTPKDPSDGYDSKLYLVYKLTVRAYSDGSNPSSVSESSSINSTRIFDDTSSLYFYVGYNQPMLLADGTCSVDLTDYSLPKKSFAHQLNEYRQTYYPGNETLDSLWSELIEPQLDDYVCESTLLSLL